MAGNGKKSEQTYISDDVRTERRRNPVEPTALELREKSESLIQNISVLRFSMARIEKLEGYVLEMRELITDCRIELAAHGRKATVARIDKLLKATGG